MCRIRVLVLFFVAGHTAIAQSQEEACRAKGFSESDCVRVSKSGTRFVADVSYLDLGVGLAYRTPSGRIWLQPLKNKDGSPVRGNVVEANIACRALKTADFSGIRIPYAYDVDQLAVDLGAAKGDYEALAADGRGVIPGIGQDSFWTADRAYGSGGGSANGAFQTFDSTSGRKITGRALRLASVLCLVNPATRDAERARRTSLGVSLDDRPEAQRGAVPQAASAPP